MEKGKLNISKSSKGKAIVKVLFIDKEGNIVIDKKGKPKELTVQNADISEEYNGKGIEFQMEKGNVTEITDEGKVLFTMKRQNQPVTNTHPIKKTDFPKTSPTPKSDENQMEMEHLEKVQYPASAPYNFIPLNKVVVEAEEIPDFDRYHDGKYTGWIDLEIETKTPLYIRDSLTEQDLKDGKESKDNPDFFSPAGKLRIPGSSLRGMVRTLVEIVSFGKFGFFDDKRLYFRGLADVSNLRKEYQQKMTSFDRQKRRPTYNISAGILKRDGLNYVIVSSDWKQILKEDAKKKVGESGANYEELSFYKLREGYLVVSGNMKNKKKDWLISFPIEKADEITIFKEDVENYKNDATRSKEVNKRMNLIERANKEDVPCFYVKWKDKAGENRVSFGHTGMFRLAYEKTIGEHIPENLKDKTKTDLAEAIFGKVSKEKTIAGRVFFEDAFLNKDQHDNDVLMDKTTPKTPKILAAPKPTTFQHYLEPSKDKGLNHYNSDSADIRGYKLYWHKFGNNWEQTNRKEIQDHKSQYTEIKPVKPETKFSGRIRFENLSEVELGALLFSLDLPEGCYHKLGMGKPLGLGSVEITPKLYLSDRKKRYSDLFAEWGNDIPVSDDIDDFKTAFKDYVLNKIGEQHKSLWDTERLKELKLMLNYEMGKGLESKDKTRYMEIERKIHGQKPENEFKPRPILPKPSCC